MHLHHPNTCTEIYSTISFNGYLSSGHAVIVLLKKELSLMTGQIAVVGESAALAFAERRMIYRGSFAFLFGNKELLVCDRTILKQSNKSMSTHKWKDIFKNSSACR
jgi:hypothetical protein